MTGTHPGFLPAHNEYVSFERHVLQDNIILCDAKSGALLGAGAVVMVWCVERFVNAAVEKSLYSRFEAGALGVAILAIIVTMYFAWRVIKPRFVTSNDDDHIFWASRTFDISEAAFTDRIQSAKPEVLAADMIRHLYILAGVCRRKFAYFRSATMAAQVAFVFVVLAVCAPLLVSFVAR